MGRMHEVFFWILDDVLSLMEVAKIAHSIVIIACNPVEIMVEHWGRELVTVRPTRIPT